MYDVRSHFLYHAPCEKCGSRDNVAVYSSGSRYCFGCGSLTYDPSIAHGHRAMDTVSTNNKKGSTVRSYPDDVVHDFPPKVVEWIKKYHLTVADLIKNNVFWSPSREQLIYTFYGEGKDVVLWQARNFRDGTTHKHRFFTGGTPEGVIAKYSQGEGRSTCVVVEDCVSAIRVSMAGCYDGIPCLGSAMQREKLARISRLYKELIVWLDDDKFNNAVKISQQGASLGLSTRVVHTELDPKEYSSAEIAELLDF